MKLTCHFTPFDTWFFRESRPQGSIGSSELASVFPPPVRTLLGAVRTAIGDAWHSKHGSNWRDFEKLDGLKALIGYADDLGPLHCTGPWLTLKGERLYPAPATLMTKDDIYFSLTLGSPVHCDLGKVHLPAFPVAVKGLDNLAGAKPATNCWLTSAGWHAILAGETPTDEHVVHAHDLFQEEPRLGIGRDNARSSVMQGLLYQTRHLRLYPDVGVELELAGLPENLLEKIELHGNQVIRLGGEGRQAALSISPAPARVALACNAPPPSPQAILYNLTPVTCAAELPAGVPLGFKPATHKGFDCWEGQLLGVELRILSISCNRPLREGGWNMASHQSRPVESLLPAGSALYVEAINGDPNTLLCLHQQCCSKDAALGRGHLLLGRIPA